MTYATGGSTSQDSDGNRIHTFLATDTDGFIVTAGGPIDYLIVAGGGAGGGYGGGGGGGGGIVYVEGSTISTGTYEIIVGSGGAYPENGGNSVFNTSSAIGGGRGGQPGGWDGANGGAGGGASIMPSGTGHNPGSGSQGGDGGAHITEDTAAGGGGGGSDGEDGFTYPPGDGGDGTAFSISGASVIYAGGGGGGHRASNSGSGGDGGLGGGGNGADWNNAGIQPGSDGRGGGGGGGVGYYQGSPGERGGSGVIIIRYNPATLQAVAGILEMGAPNYHYVTMDSTSSTGVGST